MDLSGRKLPEFHLFNDAEVKAILDCLSNRSLPFLFSKT